MRNSLVLYRVQTREGCFKKVGSHREDMRRGEDVQHISFDLLLSVASNVMHREGVTLIYKHSHART